jgi:hypothetical protein
MVTEKHLLAKAEEISEIVKEMLDDLCEACASISATIDRIEKGARRQDS